MTTTIKTFSKMLYAFVLFAGLIMTSCETADPVDDGKDQENSENTETPENPESIIKELSVTTTTTTATITGLLNIPSANIPFSEVTLYYGEEHSFSVSTAYRREITLDKNGAFELKLGETIWDHFEYNETYSYCLYIKCKSDETYSDIQSFTLRPISLKSCWHVGDATLVMPYFNINLEGQIDGIVDVNDSIGIKIYISDNLDEIQLDYNRVQSGGHAYGTDPHSIELNSSGFFRGTVQVYYEYYINSTKLYYFPAICVWGDDCDYGEIQEITVNVN